MPIDVDKTFSASVSFEGGQHGPTGTTDTGSGGDGRALPTPAARRSLLAGGALLAACSLLAR